MDHISRKIKEITPSVVDAHIDFSKFNEVDEEIQFECIVYTKLADFDGDLKSKCKQWIILFSERFNTNWIIRRRYPKAVKYLYRELFLCQHHDTNKKEKKSITTRDRKKGCRASVNIFFNKVTPYTKKTYPHVKAGRNVRITIKFTHSHKINVAEALSFLRASQSTVDVFNKYFDFGMSPAEARDHHEIVLTGNFAGEGSISEVLANTRHNPTSSTIYYLYNVWRKKCGKKEVLKENNVNAKTDTPISVSSESPKIFDKPASDTNADVVCPDNNCKLVVSRNTTLENIKEKIPSISENGDVSNLIVKTFSLFSQWYSERPLNPCLASRAMELCNTMKRTLTEGRPDDFFLIYSKDCGERTLKRQYCPRSDSKGPHTKKANVEN